MILRSRLKELRIRAALGTLVQLIKAGERFHHSCLRAADLHEVPFGDLVQAYGDAGGVR